MSIPSRHPEVAEPQPNRSMQNLNCHPELDSGSSHRGKEGSPLTPTLSRRARGKHAAFTLAEVLITLAIIGVVAVMTIPTLISDYQEKVTVTKVKKAYAALNQAYQFAKIEHGPFRTWFTEASGGFYYDENENLVEEESMSNNKVIFFGNLKPYLRVASEYTKNDSTGKYDKMYYFHGAESVEPMSQAYVLNLADGTTISGGWIQTLDCTGNDKYCGDFFIDVDGVDAGPNTYGKDIFHFAITAESFLPMGVRSNASSQKFPEKCNRLTTEANNGMACTAWVIENGNMDYLHCDDLDWDTKTKCN